MELPPTALPLLRRLRRFLAEPAMSDRCAEATRRFLGGDRSPRQAEASALGDYILYEYRDPDGRGSVDLFLEAHGAELSQKERRAFSRMKDALYGCFQIEATHRGDRLRVRRCGSSERFDVRAKRVSRTAKVGDCFFAYLIPYRSHHEIAGDRIVLLPPEFAPLPTAP